MSFETLGLAEPLLRAVLAEGYNIPTPIQIEAIPHVLAGRDLLGCAQTGTGKTAAFALPILHRLSEKRPMDGTSAGPTGAAHHSRTTRPHRTRGHALGVTPPRSIRALILTPTRELAAQIGDSFRAYGRNTHLRYTCIYGGVNQNPQTRALREGVDILIATPGRLLDLLRQGYLDLSAIEIFVLDEADRMLDMGFIHDIRTVVAELPPAPPRQTLFFSATMPRDIRRLADTILHDPVSVHVEPDRTTADRIDQTVYFVEKHNKPELLTHLLEKNTFTRVLVFTRTKHGADKVAGYLRGTGHQAEAIHGNKSQNARLRALANFRAGRTPVLIASDIAARGIDIDEISHVINYDLPNVPEVYVHRIGRTARAGAAGIAISFCDREERAYLRDIERLIRIPVPVCEDHPFYSASVLSAPPAPRPRGTHPHSHVSAHPPQQRSAHAPKGQVTHGRNKDSYPFPSGSARPAQRQAAPGRSPHAYGAQERTPHPHSQTAPSHSAHAARPHGAAGQQGQTHSQRDAAPHGVHAARTPHPQGTTGHPGHAHTARSQTSHPGKSSGGGFRDSRPGNAGSGRPSFRSKRKTRRW